MNSSRRKYSEQIKAEAIRLGFDDCGISHADYLKEEATQLKNWLHKGLHGEMDYMKNHFEKRVDPRKLVNNAKSVISVILNYYTSKKQRDSSAPIISKYAFGKDYHKVIKKKLKKLLHFIQNNIAQTNGRCFVDSAPVLDRAWAAKAGLGWIGKNSTLISPKFGSFVFIGLILVDCELAYDLQMNDMCGSCTKCISTCPTQAILTPKVIDANRCISYLTIEYKGSLPKNMKDCFENRIFGCDICQDICPWNKQIPEHNSKELQPLPNLLSLTRDEWLDMDEQKYEQMFTSSPVKRAKYQGLKRNIDFVLTPNETKK